LLVLAVVALLQLPRTALPPVVANHMGRYVALAVGAAQAAERDAVERERRALEEVRCFCCLRSGCYFACD
jgi:hypothetical protein